MKLELSADGISDYFKEMSNRANLVAGWLNRVAYPEILKVQRVRWQTEGRSEGLAWAPISERRKAYKLKKFADYPGGGRKALIATGRLVQSMTGESQTDHWKLVSKDPARLEVGSLVPYGKYVEDQGRDITTLSDDTVENLMDSLADYIMNGTLKGIE